MYEEVGDNSKKRTSMAETIREPILWVHTLILDTSAEQLGLVNDAGLSPWRAVLDSQALRLGSHIV
jgi:hypothetical protein